MGAEATIESSVTRISKLKAMLAKPFAGTAKLVAFVKGDPPIPLGEWPIGALVPALADELDQTMLEHFAEGKAAEYEYAFAFIGDDGRSLKMRTFTLRRRSEAIDAAGLVAQMDGSDRASNVLAQQTALALTRLNIASLQHTMETLTGITKQLAGQQAANDARTEEARDAYHEVREMLLELRESQQEATDGEKPSEAQEMFFKLAAQHLPLILAKLGGGGG